MVILQKSRSCAKTPSKYGWLELCTLPSVVFLPESELVALDNAQIKYSTVQNWYPGSATTRGKERCAKAAAACCRRPT